MTTCRWGRGWWGPRQSWPAADPRQLSLCRPNTRVACQIYREQNGVYKKLSYLKTVNILRKSEERWSLSKCWIHQLTSWTAQNSGFLWYYTSGHIVLIIWIKFCRSYISSFLRKKWPTYPVLWWFLPPGDHYSIFCSFSWIQLNLIIFAKLLYNKIMFFSRKQGLARLNSFCGSPNDMYDSELCTFLPTLTAI